MMANDHPNIDIKKIALRTLHQEAKAIESITQYIDEDFVKVVQLIASCKGRIIITGIGKSAIIAQKIVATFNSTSTPSVFMHAADAIHGDMGMVQRKDIVICISKSGESPEVKVLVPLLQNFSNFLIAMVGNTASYLAQKADHIINTTISQEACPNNLVPTSSTTVQLALGDALAVCLMELKGFSPDDFAQFHPGGTLGRQLYLRVQDLSVRNAMPAVQEQSLLREVIMEITGKRLGATAVVDEGRQLKGIITDGDLRRMLEKNESIDGLHAKDIMSDHPKTIQEDELAVNALALMREHNITQLIVLKGENYTGIIHLHDLIKEGII